MNEQQRKAMELALEAFKKIRDDQYSHWEVDQEIDAIEEALAQPEQRSVSEHLEPVAWLDVEGNGIPVLVYTTPPQRKPLTDEQIDFLNFLYGAGKWDGVWFEGKHPTKKGAFWWREDMKCLFDYNIKE